MTDPLLVAADRLTALADAATQGEWHLDANGWIDAGKYDEVLGPAPVECMAYCYGGSSRIEMEVADRAYVVAMQPSVARAVAELLRQTAIGCCLSIPDERPCGVCTAALAVATGLSA